MTPRGDAYRAPPTRGERGYPWGPIGHIRDGRYEDGDPIPYAIGFCTWCGANARRTCAVRGLFDCPRCHHYWYDDRVGRQRHLGLSAFVSTSE